METNGQPAGIRAELRARWLRQELGSQGHEATLTARAAQSIKHKILGGYGAFQKANSIWVLSPVTNLLLTLGRAPSRAPPALIGRFSDWPPEPDMPFSPGHEPHGAPGKRVIGQLEPWNCCFNVLFYKDARLMLWGGSPHIGPKRQEEQRVNERLMSR